MKMSHLSQGIYSPLPQSLSDSDSEKELVMENICGNNLHPESNNHQRQNGHMMNLRLGKEILKIKHVKPKMSTLRKIAFTLSILLCCLPIIIFLWVLPCSSSNTCPIKITNWEYQQDDIELKGNINLVHSAFKNSYNLALLYKGSLNTEKSLKNGAISFISSNGATAWYMEQDGEPFKLDCSVVDIDGNGIKDCLLLDGRGLKAIESISGTVKWHVHSSDETSQISELSMAVELEDFDGDQIAEVLSIYHANSLLIISGKSGKALKNVELRSLCLEITDLERDLDQVKMACHNGTQVKHYKTLISDFKKHYLNDKYNVRPTKVYGELSNDKLYIAGNRKLIVENNDNCPICHSTITLYDMKENKLKMWPFFNSYVMQPVPFSFQNTKANVISLKGHINGFIIKIWQWSEKPKKNITNSQILKRQAHPNETYYLNEVTEKLMLIMFNNTDFRVINASLTEINQLCLSYDGNINCQPDYKNQENSVLIADLDRDDSQELVSYTSSYNQKPDGTWQLVSYFKVFRLEGELPKLYGAK